MFDVQFASTLKMEFTKMFAENLNEDDFNHSNIQKERIAMLNAVQESWAKVATPDQCKKSAESVGYSYNESTLKLFFSDSRRITPDEMADTYRERLTSNKRRNPTVVQKEILETPRDQNIEGEPFDENPVAQEELKELAQNTQDGFSRLVISAKLLTSDEMMELIRAHKEKKLNKCLHRLFPPTEMVEKPIEYWVIPFFRMLAEQNTFLLSPLPSLIATNTLFKSFTQNVIFPRHLHTLTPEAIYEFETHIELQLARDPGLVEQFSSKPQIAFKSTETNEDKIFTFPKVSSVFHEEPHANSGYSSRLIDAIDVLDKALCKGLLNLMAEYYPFDDDPCETKNCISADYPYTSVLVNEYPQFYTIIQKHIEINDLVTMKPRISRPNLDIKSQTQKAADFIHLSICSLLSCDNHINSEKLKELDLKFIKMLSDNIMDVDSCNIYLKNNKSKKN